MKMMGNIKILKYFLIVMFLFVLFDGAIVANAAASYCCYCQDAGCFSYSTKEERNKDCTQTNCKAVECEKEKNCSNSLGGSSSLDKVKYNAGNYLNPASVKVPTDLIGRAIKLLFAFVGSISVVLYLYAGILWMTAGGGSENIEKAKKVLFWTTAGLAAMFASYVLVKFLFALVK